MSFFFPPFFSPHLLSVLTGTFSTMFKRWWELESCFYKGKHSFHVYLEGKCFFSVLSLVLTMGLFYMVASSLLSYILPTLTFPRILCCEKAQRFDTLTFPRILCCEKAQRFDMFIWASFFTGFSHDFCSFPFCCCVTLTCMLPHPCTPVISCTWLLSRWEVLLICCSIWFAYVLLRILHHFFSDIWL